MFFEGFSIIAKLRMCREGAPRREEPAPIETLLPPSHVGVESLFARYIEKGNMAGKVRTKRVHENGVKFAGMVTRENHIAPRISDMFFAAHFEPTEDDKKKIGGKPDDALENEWGNFV
jgi:hypothetical protein